MRERERIEVRFNKENARQKEREREKENKDMVEKKRKDIIKSYFSFNQILIPKTIKFYFILNLNVL